ncbi:MAG: ABC transporter permease [Plesiomonas sp.]|uniref:ABC transporter permease n=2 Tax=Plesiomonas sp. TaxID=2486279 RepID=UPI003F301D6B
MTLGQIWREEVRALSKNAAILMTVFVGLIFYSVLYPQPYSHQVVTSMPVAVWDSDHSALSRQFIRMVEATPQVEITHNATSQQEADQWLQSGEVHGLLVIPQHFSRDVLMGKSPVIAAAGDASYFLVYSSIIEGIARAAGTLGAQVKVTKELMQGTPYQGTLGTALPLRAQTEALFNPSIGYIAYIVPAVFVLILHQTLLIAAGIQTAEYKERTLGGEHGYWQTVSPWKLLLARGLVFVPLYLVAAMYYLGTCFDYYNVVRQANPWILLLLCTLLFWTTYCFAVMITFFMTRRETPTQAVLLSSLPMVFTAGFVWPIIAIPEPIIWLARLIPGVNGIELMVQYNQMGASLSEASDPLLRLVIQAVVYTVLAGWVLLHSQRLAVNKVVSVSAEKAV